jgi:hypothetical protein
MFATVGVTDKNSHPTYARARRDHVDKICRSDEQSKPVHRVFYA